MIRSWWQERIIKGSNISSADWRQTFDQLPLLQRLDAAERGRLQRLATLFLHYKSMEAAGGLELTRQMQRVIALQACLLILNLGLDWYNGWVSIVIYPGAFAPQHSEMDEYGVMHHSIEHLSGESWERGPVILAWDEVSIAQTTPGYNVVIHEFAHKLDMLDGTANGLPPLHKDMSVTHWSEVFSAAYADLEQRLAADAGFPIDEYALTSAGEFFAVCSEVFFTQPEIVVHYYPAVYRLLAQFYRQNPAAVAHYQT